VANTTINGVFTEGSNAVIFNGTPPTGFNYNSTAALSNITGSWSGYTTSGSAAALTISSTGTFNGSGQGCTFLGTITPSSTGKNYFDVFVTFAGSSCSMANVSLTGVAATTTSSSPKGLLLAATSGSNASVFVLSQ
jgi:hypothetical protein